MSGKSRHVGLKFQQELSLLGADVVVVPGYGCRHALSYCVLIELVQQSPALLLQLLGASCCFYDFVGVFDAFMNRFDSSSVSCTLTAKGGITLKFTFRISTKICDRPGM